MGKSMLNAIKYVPQSNIVASENPQVFLQQQAYVVSQLNSLQDIRNPPLTLQEYQRRNNL